MRLTQPAPARWQRLGALALFGYLFFLAIELLGRGMKTSFAQPLQGFLTENAAEFTELRSFVIGVIGTAFVQSSSTVTSMCVVLTQEGIMPLLIAAGIVHGANLGTSVTSSIVAFATAVPPLTGNPLRDLRTLLLVPRGPRFERAVGTAVVHDFFNIIMITAILLFLELPFGWILAGSEWLSSVLEARISSSDWLLDVLGIVSPGTYTKPVSGFLLRQGIPGWALAAIGVPLLFGALKGFSSRMKAAVLDGVEADDVAEMGRLLLGTHPADTFLRGLVLTVLVQSSSATTSMVVPLAAMGFFGVRRIFPFILGANIGTTATAFLAATAAVGQPGFHEGMTIALAHVLLNTVAVVLAVVVVGLPTSILASAEFLGEHAARRPVVLLAYLFLLTVALPLLVYVFPQYISGAVMSVVMLGMLVAPHVYARRKLEQRLQDGGLHPRSGAANP